SVERSESGGSFDYGDYPTYGEVWGWIKTNRYDDPEAARFVSAIIKLDIPRKFPGVHQEVANEIVELLKEEKFNEVAYINLIKDRVGEVEAPERPEIVYPSYDEVAQFIADNSYHEEET